MHPAQSWWYFSELLVQLRTSDERRVLEDCRHDSGGRDGVFRDTRVI